MAIIENIVIEEYKEPSYKDLLLSLMEMQSFLPISGSSSLLCLLTFEAIKKAASECSSEEMEIPDLRKAQNTYTFFEQAFTDTGSEIFELYKTLKENVDMERLEKDLAVALGDFADWSATKE